MRLFISTLAAISMVLVAGSASALVTVDHSSAADGSTLNPGDTFVVSVTVSWDGSGALQGVFASTGLDSSVVGLVGADWFGIAETASSIFDQSLPVPPYFLPGLSRLGGLSQPGDTGDVIRTVQYGGTSALDAAAAANGVLVTELTMIAVGGGSTQIGAVLAAGDSGAAGDDYAAGSSVTVNVIPEPGTALLMGLGLAGLAAAGRRD